MARPARAPQARSPNPLMRAGRASSARVKRIPTRITAAVKIFGRARVGAQPAARFCWRPTAQRTADFFKIVLYRVFCERFENFFGFRRFSISHKSQYRINEGEIKVSTKRIFVKFYRRGVSSPIVQTMTELDKPKPESRPAIMTTVSPFSTTFASSSVFSPSLSIASVVSAAS